MEKEVAMEGRGEQGEQGGTKARSLSGGPVIACFYYGP